MRVPANGDGHTKVRRLLSKKARPERLDGVVVLLLFRQLDRGRPVLRARVRLQALLEQELDQVDAAVAGGEVQRRPPVLVRRVGVGAAVDEHPTNRVRPALLRSLQQPSSSAFGGHRLFHESKTRGVFLLRQIRERLSRERTREDVRGRREQPRDARLGPRDRRRAENGGLTRLVREVDVRVLSDQEGHDGLVARFGRHHQGRHAIVVRGVNLGTLAQQQSHHLLVTLLTRHV